MKKLSKRIKIIIFSLVIVFSIIPGSNIYAKSKDIKADAFWIEYIDVGQGDASLIQCDGEYMLIDGGSSSSSSLIYTILKNKEINNLKYIIGTHGDADHIGGLAGALNYAKVGDAYCSVTESDTRAFNSFLKYLDKQGKILKVPKAGDTFELGSAKITILGPINESEDSNNMSIVIKITYGKTSFLFTGDAETDEEKDIIKKYKRDINCDVLKVGHHGSASSTSTEFLNAVKPKIAVISCGLDNSYGHPTQTVLDSINKKGAEIYRTDLHGDVFCYSDGKKLTFATEKRATIADVTRSDSNKRKNSTNSSGNNEVIPSGTTYVLNNNTKRFHLVSCASVKQISTKNIAFSKDTAENLVANGYKACGNCRPPVNITAAEPTKSANTDKTKSAGSNTSEAKKQEGTKVEQPAVQTVPTQSYVLNTNTKKFHYPECGSVSQMKAKNRKDVVDTRDNIIANGYDSCGRCHP